MKTLIEHVSSWAFLGLWVAGWVLAKGFWSTLVAIFIPPWSLYLVVEAFLPAIK